MRARFFLLLLLPAFLLGACQKRTAQKAEEAETVHSKVDACSLLTKEEIQEVQGSPVKENLSTNRADGGLYVSQCYYSAETSNRSVSLTLTQTDPDAPAKRSAKELWEQTFSRFESETKERAEEKEKAEEERARDPANAAAAARERAAEEGGPPPERIKGLGDDAYWIGSRVGGALYILRKGVFLRLSLGGPDEGPAKIEKSKKLAEKAVKRL